MQGPHQRMVTVKLTSNPFLWFELVMHRLFPPALGVNPPVARSHCQADSLIYVNSLNHRGSGAFARRWRLLLEQARTLMHTKRASSVDAGKSAVHWAPGIAAPAVGVTPFRSLSVCLKVVDC